MNLREREHLVYLKRENGMEGVYVYQEDLLIAKHVYVHKVIRSTSLHEYFNFLSKGKRSRTSVTNRLSKLTSAGILIRMKKSVGNNNFYNYYYKIGKRGLELLAKYKYIDGSVNIQYLYGNIRNLKFPSSHNIAISKIANQCFIQCLENPRIGEFENLRGDAHPDFVREDSALIPDWVFFDKETVICIECDTGYQRQHVIKRKNKMYLKKAEELNEQGKRLIVIFSVIDENIDYQFQGDREKRVASLKASVPPLHSWPKDRGEVNGLGISFYVVNGTRTPMLISRLLSYQTPLTEIDRLQSALDWQQKALYLLSEDYEFTMLDKDELFRDTRTTELDCELVFEWHKTNSRLNLRRRRHLFGLIFGEEGSALTYQMIAANLKRLSQFRDTDVYSSATVLVCYEDVEQATYDIYGLPLQDCRLAVTDSETWGDALTNNKEAPEFLVMTSNFIKSKKGIDVV